MFTLSPSANDANVLDVNQPQRTMTEVMAGDFAAELAEEYHWQDPDEK